MPVSGEFFLKHENVSSQNHEVNCQQFSPTDTKTLDISKQQNLSQPKERNLGSTLTDKEVNTTSLFTNLSSYFNKKIFSATDTILDSFFSNPQWVQDKFDLIVKNVFLKFDENHFPTDCMCSDNELAKLVRNIFEQKDQSHDPRTNYTTFLKNLRNTLTSTLFENALANTKLNPNPNTVEQNQLVAIVLEICRIHFTEGHYYSFFNKTLNDLGLSEEGEVKLNHEDFNKLNHLDSEHQMSWVKVLVERVESIASIHYDSHKQGNCPYAIATLNIADKNISLLRIGTPTIEEPFETAKVNPEIHGFFESLSFSKPGQEEKNHLYISLQNDLPRTLGIADERARNLAIKDVQKKYKNVFVVVLAQDSPFYKQLDHEGEPIDSQGSDRFLENFYHEMFSDHTGFYFPEVMKNDSVFKKNVLELLKSVHQILFNDENYQEKLLSRTERLNFIEIFYVYLAVYLMHYSKADSANISCKDAIDRAGKFNSLLLQFFLIMTGKANDRDYQRMHQVYTHMPAMWARGRSILLERRERLEWAFNLMCQKTEEIQHAGLFVFNQEGEKIALIDPQTAIAFHP